MFEGLVGFILMYFIVSAIFDWFGRFINKDKNEAVKEVKELKLEDAALISATIESAGLCTRCGTDSLWNMQHEFEHATANRTICSTCDWRTVDAAGPIARQPEERYSKSVSRTAGLCLKCGEDALWHMTLVENDQTETSFVCFYCETDVTGRAPEVRMTKSARTAWS